METEKPPLSHSDGENTMLPEIKINKNGYEIRSDLIGFAKEFMLTEYQYKLGEYNHKVSAQNGKLEIAVTFPTPPTPEDVIACAEKFMAFVKNK